MGEFYVKLMDATIEDSINEFCKPYCEPERNQLGYCPSACIPFCYPICNRPFLNSIPPIQQHLVSKTIDYSTSRTQTDDGSQSFFLLYFLTMIFIGFAIFLCYAFSKLAKSWFDSMNEPEQEIEQEDQGNAPPGAFLDQELEHEVGHPIWDITSEGLQPSVINSITILKFRKEDIFIEGTECSVCLNNFQEDEALRLLPNCNHAFHVACIDIWLKSHSNCPMCRADIEFLSPAKLPPSSPEQQNICGDSEELWDQEGAETEPEEVEFPNESEDEPVESSTKE
ncbi:hypothetical protein Leryth_013996 [Lithospermum erythrorhizon]|nr:hypothetical protein Leryth_013996 [Lithospermum erythrorhizon]